MRQENTILQEKEIKIKSLETGWRSVALAMLLLIVWRIIHNESPIDILIILFAYNSGESFYNYRKSSAKKKYLLTGAASIIGLGLGIAALLSQYGVY